MSFRPMVRRSRGNLQAVRAAGDAVPETLESRRLMAVNLFFEDFERLELGPFVSPSEGGGTGADWTSTLPPGWSRNNTVTPTGGPVEFFGFTFLNKDSWIATEGNQERNLFTRGTGTVMVSDPDAYDDIGEIDGALYNVFIQTPPIPVTNVRPGTATLNFDSSFRPYETMTASVEVSFNGGTNWTTLLSMNSANVPGGDSSLERVDEALSFPLEIPAGAASVIVRFGMTEAGNDWWWAVDNIAVNATLDLTGVRLIGMTGNRGDEGGSNPENDETIWNVAYAPAPMTVSKILRLPHVPDGDAIGFNPESGLLHHTSGAESWSNTPSSPGFRDNQFMETVDVVSGSNTLRPIFNANSEQWGLPAPRPTWVEPTERRTDDQTDQSFRVRGPNEYHTARDLTWSAADHAFYVADENGIFKLTADGQSTFVGNPSIPQGGVKGLAFALVNGVPRLIAGQRDGSNLYFLDPETGTIVGDAIGLITPDSAPIPGVLSLITHPGTGEIFALGKSTSEPGDPLQRELLRIEFSPDLLSATGTSLGTFTGLQMADLAFVYPSAAAATVSEVYVRGSAWSTAFKAYAEAQALGDDVYGYRVDNKTGDQAVLPWVNANEIVLRYSAAPTGGGIPTPGTVTLTGDRAGGNYTVTAVNQLDPQTFVLVLDRPLGSLSTGGQNGVRINLVVPGGGSGGANFTQRLNALQGDVFHTGESNHLVVANDASDVKPRFFRSTAAPGPAGPTQYTIFHDVDGSGNIIANDFSLVKARFFNSLQTTPFPVAALQLASITADLFGSKRVLG